MILDKLLIDIDISECKADTGIDITGVSCSSATIRPGELFIAVKGYKSDGHKYIKEAADKGASCVICQYKPDIEIPYITVPDSRKAQALVSAAWFGHPAKKMSIIGVTGTNGKTSVSYIVKHIIEQCSGSKVGLIGTIGNLIGDRELKTELTTPDSYQLHCIFDKMVLEGCRYAVMEVSSHALCLHRVYGIEFDIGIFTNLTAEHMDFHKTMDEYAKAKAMLFKNCRRSCINLDDSYADRMIKSAGDNVITYSASGNTAQTADITAANIKLRPDETQFTYCADGTTGLINLRIPGIFSVYNALAAIGAGLLSGFDTEDIEKALSIFAGVKGRAEILPINKEYNVLIDYAHTPDALENILKTARSISSGRVVTLFGCGGDRDKTKRPLMGKIAVKLSDITFVTSDNPRTENPKEIIEDILKGIANTAMLYENGRLKVVENRREAICKALDILLLGDMLVIAGKGHETYQIVGTEKIQFDDREIVSEHLRRLREIERKGAVRSEESV